MTKTDEYPKMSDYSADAYRKRAEYAEERVRQLEARVAQLRETLQSIRELAELGELATTRD